MWSELADLKDVLEAPAPPLFDAETGREVVLEACSSCFTRSLIKPGLVGMEADLEAASEVGGPEAERKVVRGRVAELGEGLAAVPLGVAVFLLGGMLRL